jgi:regulator of protease activity HflC (stomatin/prohibitin superfamily)
MSKFTIGEKLLKSVFACASVPFAPFYLRMIPQNHHGVIQRFGKIDRIVEPGLRWAPPGGCVWYNVFAGQQTHTFKDLQILDANGTPIVVSAILQFQIVKPDKFIVNANKNLDVLERESQIAIRGVCNKYPFDSPTEQIKNLRKNIEEVSLSLQSAIGGRIEDYGFKLEAFNIIQVNYAPEVMQQMLMKQQARAYIEARREIVDGAIGVAKETIDKFPDLSKSTQEQIVCNLLTTLTSGSSPQPVLHLK